MKIIAFLLFFSMYAQADSIADLRSCVAQLRTPMKYQDREALVLHCYSLATPLKYSPEISGRSLYIVALSQLLSMETSSFNGTDAILEKAFDEAITPSLSAPTTDQELNDIFEATSFAYFYSPFLNESKSGVRLEQRLFTQIELRSLVTNDQARELISALERNSEWLDARTLSLKYPADGEILLVHGAATTAPAYLIDNGGAFSIKKAHFSGAQIVMSGSCHLAVSAIEEFAKHADIVDLWSKHGLAIADSELRNLTEIRDLKAKYPQFEMHPVMNMSAWTKAGFDMTASPTFAFLKNGLVVYSLPGFYYNGQMIPKFCEGLKKIGLSTSSCNL